MLLDLEVDGAWRRIRKEILEFLFVHREISFNTG
jgi:hypothetical protein